MKVGVTIKIRKLLITSSNRPRIQIIPRALVIHYTGNYDAGADAVANRNYFQNHPEAKVSAHYCVDDKEAVQCIPENEMAYHVGSKWYTPEALNKLGSYPNNCTIGIEMCVNSDGDFNKTYINTIELSVDIMKRHNFNTDNLWRHYDITGKLCPAMWCGSKEKDKLWEKFKSDVSNTLISESVFIMFKDITNHWSKEDVLWLAEKGIIKGDNHGNFNPDNKITRAEFAAGLRRALEWLIKELKEPKT